MSKIQKGFSLILILLFIFGVAFVATAGWFVYHKQNNTPAKKDAHAIQAYTVSHKNCPSSDANFQYLPISVEQLDSWIPLGNAADAHVIPPDHMYFVPKQQPTSDYTVPVVMPSDGRIIHIDNLPANFVGDQKVTKETANDYNVQIAHSCRYFSVFIHLHKLSDVVASKVGTLAPEQNKNLSIDLKAGDTIGYIGNAPFDWSLIDTQTTLSGFISPRLYQNVPQWLHIIDPTTVYSGKLKADFIAKSRRQEPPYGGRIDWDQPGKLIGNWFRAGTSGVQKTGNRYWDNQLAIIPDAVDNKIKIYSTGNWQGVAQQFVIKDAPPIDTITPESGIQKYQLLRRSNGPTRDVTNQLAGVVLLQVLPDEQLKVEQFPDKQLNDVSSFTSAATLYYR